MWWVPESWSRRLDRSPPSKPPRHRSQQEIRSSTSWRVDWSAPSRAGTPGTWTHRPRTCSWQHIRRPGSHTQYKPRPPGRSRCCMSPRTRTQSPRWRSWWWRRRCRPNLRSLHTPPGCAGQRGRRRCRSGTGRWRSRCRPGGTGLSCSSHSSTGDSSSRSCSTPCCRRSCSRR